MTDSPEPTGKSGRRKRYVTETPNAWQNQEKHRASQNRGPRLKGAKQAAAEQEYYHPDNHPKSAEGINICGAKIEKSRSKCQRVAGYNTDHLGWGKCSFHGGATPTLRSSAAKWMGGEVIDRMTTNYGYGAPLELSPVDALLGEVQRAGGHVAWLGEAIASEGLWEATSEEGHKVLTPGQKEMIELYHEERRLLVKAAKTALDAGVNERKVRLAEMQGALMLQAFHTVFDQLNLSTDQRRLLPVIVPQALRSITDPVRATAEIVQPPKDLTP